VFSDLGSQLVAGGNIVGDFLKDVEAKKFLEENAIQYHGFEHYFKGNSALGSLVEVFVKAAKRLIYGAMRNLILDSDHFRLVVAECKQLINARPVAYKEALRDCENEDLPAPISPELLLTGRELITCNVIPYAQPSEADVDEDWTTGTNMLQSLRNEYSKIRKVRSRLIKDYNEDFLGNLVAQAVDTRDRYKRVPHEKLRVGDIILLKEQNMKSNLYPKAIVREVVTNVNNEVTCVIAMKGNTRETVRRHVSSVIKLMSCNPAIPQIEADGTIDDCSIDDGSRKTGELRRGPKRSCNSVYKS